MIENKMDSLTKKRRVDAEIHQREEEGTVLDDIEARLTRNLCECILYFYCEICGIPENVPRFLKNAFHIPEERHLGLASLNNETNF